MKKLLFLLVGVSAFCILHSAFAAGGADYGRGPETDPVGVAAATVNTSAITAEVARATAAEGVNTSAITAEVARATSAEGVNTSAITVEVARATAAEGANYSAITVEVARATAAEAASITYVNTNVWGAPGITPSVDATTNTVTIQAKDLAAGDLSAYRVLHVWLSDSDLGAATTNGIETLTLSGGTAVATVTANADYWYLTSSAGAAAAEVIGTAAGTNYIMVVDGSTVNSAAVVFE